VNGALVLSSIGVVAPDLDDASWQTEASHTVGHSPVLLQTVLGPTD
jgi:hypothetical protein